MNVDLDQLAEMLKKDGFPPQTTIAAVLGVDQSLVSRARSGRLKRVTPNVQLLWRYAITRIEDMRTDQAAFASVIADDLQDRAESVVRGYLADGFDARLLVEQIAVLRRAQSRHAAKGERAAE